MALPANSTEHDGAAIVGAARKPPADVRGLFDPGAHGQGQGGGAEDDRPTAATEGNKVSYTAYAAPARRAEWWSDPWTSGVETSGATSRDGGATTMGAWRRQRPSHARGGGASVRLRLIRCGCYFALRDVGFPDPAMKRSPPAVGPPETWASLAVGLFRSGLGRCRGRRPSPPSPRGVWLQRRCRCQWRQELGATPRHEAPTRRGVRGSSPRLPASWATCTARCDSVRRSRRCEKWAP